MHISRTRSQAGDIDGATQGMDMSNEIRRQIGARLKEAREAMGWKQEEVAARLKKKRQAVSKWELGIAMPDPESWFLIGQMFGKSLDYLVYGAHSQPVSRSPMMDKIFKAPGIDVRVGPSGTLERQQTS